jgi:hypothetical protein
VSSGHKKISMEATTEGEVRTAVAIAARNAPSAQGRSPGARRQTSGAYPPERADCFFMVLCLPEAIAPTIL